MYKYIIWDFDGTVIDSYTEIFNIYQMIFDKFNVAANMDEVKEKLLRFSSKEAKEMIYEKYNITPEDFNNEYEKLASEEESLKRMTFLNNSNVVIKKLKDMGLKNFISTDRDITAEKIIGLLNSLDLFEDIVYIGKNGMMKRKPDPEGVNYLIETYGLNKEEILYVGDRDLDYNTATNAKIDCCMYKPIDGYQGKPKYIIDDFEELLNIVNK